MKPRILLYSLFSSILLWLSLPNFNAGYLAWLGFIPLFFAIQNQTKRKAFWFSYLCGFIFFLLTLYWLIHVTLVGLIVLCLYLAFYFAFFGYFFVVFKSKFSVSSLAMVISLSCVWVILEYLRGQLLTGFPWALLGYSQYLNIKVIQFADITGALGVSFFVIFVNLSIFVVIKSLISRDYKVFLKMFFSLLLVLIVVYAYGTYSVKKYSSANDGSIRVSLLQGNVPQREKWLSIYREKIRDNYRELALWVREDDPDLIIWPETAYPDYIIDSDKRAFNRIKKIVREVKRPILFGAVYQEDYRYFNGAFLMPGDLSKVSIYKKIHLVPFGEYLPLRRYFPFLEQFIPIEDFNAGSEFVVFNTQNKQGESINFGVLICFEDTISELSRQFRLRGADFLINITNDAWFKQSSSPYQHLQASVFRAVENRSYLVRAANTGITCIIDFCGRVLQRVSSDSKKDIFIRGAITGDIKIQKTLSLYSRFGDVFVLLCFVFAFLFIIYPARKRIS